MLQQLVPNAFFMEVQKVCCHIKQLGKWLDLRLKGLAWLATKLSHHYVIQIETS
jgi:hypothetical protein